ncbi:DUF1127 domain-containing protein [Paracoccus litorisediminis]|uniref:hypothetical protein n=1 Tax=Paracoccus litorisediminis TaxID=2006130 RepID=UPI00373023A5
MHASAIAQSRRLGVSEAALPRLARRLKAYLVARRVAGETRAQLEMNTDRDLADLGLSRFDINRIALQAGREAAAHILAS